MLDELITVTLLRFLSKVCKPAVEELKAWGRDTIRVYRFKNTLDILEKTKGKLIFENDKLQIHPQLLEKVFDKGSWVDDEDIQEYWASLLKTSASEFPTTENSMYFDILSQLTKSEILMIEYFCKESKLDLNNPFQINASKEGVIIDAHEFYKIVGNSDSNRLASEIEHLKGLRLVETGLGLASGFFQDSEDGKQKVGLKMSTLAINFYHKVSAV